MCRSVWLVLWRRLSVEGLKSRACQKVGRADVCPPRLECGYARHGGAGGERPDRTRFGGYAVATSCSGDARPPLVPGRIWARKGCAAQATHEAAPMAQLAAMGVADDPASGQCLASHLVCVKGYPRAWLRGWTARLLLDTVGLNGVECSGYCKAAGCYVAGQRSVCWHS
jgi:hypothetical protein